MPRRKIRKAFTVAKLKKRAQKSHQNLSRQFPHVASKLKDLNLDLKDLRRHSTKMLSAAALAGALFVTSPTTPTAHPTATSQERTLSEDEVAQKLKQELQFVLPHKVGPISPQLEERVHEIVQKNLGVNAVATFEGNHLNTSYGYIGAEQHLPRYPGDVESDHDELQFKGVTPGRGAWGYFAPSRGQLTQKDIQREKYYVAVQTMYLPNWKKDLRYLRDWYKYREVIVVNPHNGKAVVAVIADAGPAAWTGKHFGGSPELMRDLELNTGKQKGAVLLFFVDDPEETLALGPLQAGKQDLIANR